MRADVLIVSNGPGELSAWVRPVAKSLRRALPDARLVVALVPCPYASGAEADAVRAWGLDLEVWTPRETLGYMLAGRAPGGYVPATRGAVLFMGGDQLFGVLLSRRAGYPLLTYTETAARWPSFTRQFLHADREAAHRLHARGRRARHVGNMMVDAVAPRMSPAEARQALGLRGDDMVLGLLPGSKPFKVRYVTPLFLKVAERLQAERPGLRVTLHRSPYTPLDQLAAAAADERCRAVTGGALGRLVHEDGADWLVTDGGAKVRIVPPELHLEGLSVADLALTVPGTNTAELAILGVPMVVALPLHKPEEIPLDGLLGRLAKMPALGPALMRAVAGRFLARQPLVALPNQRAGRMVTPELLGAFAPESLAQLVGELLDDALARREIKLQLHAVMGAAGASREVTDAVLGVLGATAVPRTAQADPRMSEP